MWWPRSWTERLRLPRRGGLSGRCFFNVLEYAMERKLLTHNPIVRLRVRRRQTKVVETVDRRVVANPNQARELLAALTYVGGRDRFRGWKLRA